jgi:hypothetical protein
MVSMRHCVDQLCVTLEDKLPVDAAVEYDTSTDALIIDGRPIWPELTTQLQTMETPMAVELVLDALREIDPGRYASV